MQLQKYAIEDIAIDIAAFDVMRVALRMPEEASHETIADKLLKLSDTVHDNGSPLPPRATQASGRWMSCCARPSETKEVPAGLRSIAGEATATSVQSQVTTGVDGSGNNQSQAGPQQDESVALAVPTQVQDSELDEQTELSTDPPSAPGIDADQVRRQMRRASSKSKRDTAATAGQWHRNDQHHGGISGRGRRSGVL